VVHRDWQNHLKITPLRYSIVTAGADVHFETKCYRRASMKIEYKLPAAAANTLCYRRAMPEVAASLGTGGSEASQLCCKACIGALQPHRFTNPLLCHPTRSRDKECYKHVMHSTVVASTCHQIIRSITLRACMRQHAAADPTITTLADLIAAYTHVGSWACGGT
jgi:hypothetical protein